MAAPVNCLYYGDNLDVLREHIETESIDLIYLDPPFNSNRDYNVIFSRDDTVRSADQAQIQAFSDTWRWTPTTERQFMAAVGGGLPNEVATVLSAMRAMLGENDAMVDHGQPTRCLVEIINEDARVPIELGDVRHRAVPGSLAQKWCPPRLLPRHRERVCSHLYGIRDA